MMSSTTRFNVRLPAPVMRQIKREAQARHLTMSAVVRAVLCTHYHRKEPR
jgi:predicted DNA binding CopG/RHH family protein